MLSSYSHNIFLIHTQCHQSNPAKPDYKGMHGRWIHGRWIHGRWIHGKKKLKYIHFTTI
jgi:hypothetical protein